MRDLKKKKMYLYKYELTTCYMRMCSLVNTSKHLLLDHGCTGIFLAQLQEVIVKTEGTEQINSA